MPVTPFDHFQLRQDSSTNLDSDLGFFGDDYLGTLNLKHGE